MAEGGDSARRVLFEHRRSRPRVVSSQIAPHAVTYAVIAVDHPFGSLLDDVDPALQEGDFEGLETLPRGLGDVADVRLSLHAPHLFAYPRQCQASRLTSTAFFDLALQCFVGAAQLRRPLGDP